MALFETSLTSQQLRKRHEAAWWNTRHRRPVTGVTLHLDSATFDLVSDLETARNWVAQSSAVVAHTTVLDTFAAATRDSSDRTKMVLIAAPSSGHRGCVLHMSHTLINHEGFKIIQEYLAGLRCARNELGIAAIFSPDFLKDIMPRLPASLCHSYWLSNKPSHADLEEVRYTFERSQARWSHSSIGIPVHPLWKSRPSHVHNRTVMLAHEDCSRVIRVVKKLGITITTAFFACITSGICQHFSSGKEDGAHLVFSYNASRWITMHARAATTAPVTMSIIPAGMWIDANKVSLQPKDQYGLLLLSKEIKEAQRQETLSPHIVALYDRLAPSMVQTMKHRGQDESVLPTSRPTLTSQGHFEDHCTDNTTGGDVKMIDFNTGGRNTDPCVCFALNGFQDTLRFNLLFDERYFEATHIMGLAKSVADLFHVLVAENTTLAPKI